MAVTCDWRVDQMEAYPEKDGFSDVVFIVHWRVNANDGSYNATSYGTVNIPLNLSDKFTPYSNLTQNQVLGWVKEALGNDEVVVIESNLAKQIFYMINNPIITIPNPWDVYSVSK